MTLSEKMFQPNFRVTSDFGTFYFSACEGDECNRGQTSSSSSSSVVKSQQPSKDFLGQFTQVNSPNSADQKHRDASAVLPFIGLTGSKCTVCVTTSCTAVPYSPLHRVRSGLYTEKNND